MQWWVMGKVWLVQGSFGKQQCVQYINYLLEEAVAKSGAGGSMDVPVLSARWPSPWVVWKGSSTILAELRIHWLV